MQVVTAPQFDGETFMARTIGRIDLSSWISWACYSAGFFVAATPAAANELRAGGPAAFLLIAAVVAFFATAATIQQHMHLSLRASTFGHPVRLVTDGVFRYSRNPIYVAFLMPLASLACMSLVAALATCIVYVAAMTFLVIKPEERVLAREFGNAYTDYRSRVPRWFAFL